MRLYTLFLKSAMLPFANKTHTSEIEYTNIILMDGSYIILEGDERKVTIPFPKGIATVHTHPGICLFSHNDLETADSLFSRGYIIVSVMNKECITSLYRRGVYTFEDKQILKDISKKLRIAKTINEVLSIYKNLTFKDYLKIVTLLI
ncbi:MAG: hypothetical protein QXS44_04075 [Saccharolobus sp.]